MDTGYLFFLLGSAIHTFHSLNFPNSFSEPCTSWQVTRRILKIGNKEKYFKFHKGLYLSYTPLGNGRNCSIETVFEWSVLRTLLCKGNHVGSGQNADWPTRSRAGMDIQHFQPHFEFQGSRWQRLYSFGLLAQKSCLNFISDSWFTW